MSAQNSHCEYYNSYTGQYYEVHFNDYNYKLYNTLTCNQIINFDLVNYKNIKLNEYTSGMSRNNYYCHIFIFQLIIES